MKYTYLSWVCPWPKSFLKMRWTYLPPTVYFMMISWGVGEGNVNPLQYSCLENPMGRGAWWAAVHDVTKSRTWLSDFTFTFHFHLHWRRKWQPTPVFLPGESRDGGAWGATLSKGSHRVGHNWSDLAAAAVEEWLFGCIMSWWRMTLYQACYKSHTTFRLHC